ncbi:serine/threonine-protein kinase Smg1 [Eurosta solidaginis]|uniref:serine/threonine-protein kinase Smg1 n=1 Tax=Eurosta solidaginis TaxID=178769 RepID=UPI003530DCA9
MKMSTKMSSVVVSHVYSEDMKISKLLRRLLMENNGPASLELCNKLEMAVRAQTNATYICRSFDLLMDNMLSVLKQCPKECLEKASTVMGVMGYINRNDFPIYKNYIMKAYQTQKSIRKYLMLALKTTFSCDAVNLDLSVYSERLLAVLKDYLENAELADTFIAVSETISEFCKHYKRAFDVHFTDIVDIIVGWHLEAEQPSKLKLQCSATLQQFAPYFLKELDFTFGLLGQFLEDIVALGDEITHGPSPTASLTVLTGEAGVRSHMQKVEVRIGCFVGAFNSILKSLANRMQFVGIIVGQNIVNEAAVTISKTAEQTLEVTMVSESTIMNINEFFCLLFANATCDVIKLVNIEELIALEMIQLNHLGDAPKLTLLYLIHCVFRQLRTNLPLSTVTLVFKPTHNPLASIKFTNNDKLRCMFLKVYHEVLMVKNVPLLQEAYRHITIDILNTIETLETHDETLPAYTSAILQAEATLSFYLTALSVLATQTSSIISMYALHPSILELLIIHCKAGANPLWQRHPTLHAALLNVLVIHCLRNHNFRTTSRLLTTELISTTTKHALDEKSSPTSENFSLILNFVDGILSAANDLNVTNLNLLLDWIICIFIECRENATVLEQHTTFNAICKSISQATFLSPLKCAKSIEMVLEYAVINFEVLEYFRDAAIIMLDACDAHVRNAYTTILAKLPLSTCLTSVRIDNHISLRKSQLNDLMQWYRSTTYYAPLRSKYFKTFLERIDIDAIEEYESFCQFTLEIFSKSWVSRYRESSTAYEIAVRRSCQGMALWLEYEAARQCVRNKLRTSLGKPQETFLAIEAIISKYARILSTKSGLSSASNGRKVALTHMIALQRNTRVLLGFIDSLEKHIYNAAEGTAFAIPALDKPVKTFFRINAHTCNEWLNRIRPSVNLIAMHSMMPELVIRNSEAILRISKLTDMQLDHTIITLVWALLCCDEPSSLYGLHIWLKSHHPKAAKRCVWILYAAEQALGRKEHAADSYEAFLSERDSNLDARIKDFVVDQLMYCLYYTGQWGRCRRIQTRYKNGEKNNSGGYYYELAEALVNDYESEASRSAALQNALMELSSWTQNNNECNSKDTHIPETFSYYHITQKLQDACVLQALKWNAMSCPPLSAEFQHCIRSGVQELPYHNSVCRIGEHRNALSDILILNHVAQKLFTTQHMQAEEKLSGMCSVEDAEKSTCLLKFLLWTLLFDQRMGAPVHSACHYSLYLDVAHRARCEGNGGFCRTMLQCFFRKKGFQESLSEVSRQLRENEYMVSVRDADLVRGFSELAKCSYVTSANQINAISLGAAYCTQIIKQFNGQQHGTYPPSSADMLLTLADWLSPRVGGISNGLSAGGVSSAPNNNINAALALREMQELLQALPDISVNFIKESGGNEAVNALIPPAEKAIGRLINASIYQQSDSCDAWFAYGNWCYRWGKRLMEAKQPNEMKALALPQRDMHAIREVLGGQVSDEAISQVVSVLNAQQLSNLDTEEEDIEKSELTSSELIEQALRRVDVLAYKPSEQIASIIKIWRQAHRSVYVYYEMATKAYFTYLTIGTVQSENKRATTIGAVDCTPVTVTLRLLRLIVKYAAGLQEVLEEGLRTTPLRPWKVIVPQLFSRLNHHEPYVRKSVSDLLCRLAQDRPHLIIFPAVVGAHQEIKDCAPVNSAFKEKLTVDDDAQTKETKCNTLLSNCFRSLLHTLSQQAPDTVAHVQMLVRELKRVTLLWEEYWGHAVSQLYSEYAPLFNALELELKKCGGTATEKILAKHAVLMQHLAYDMERIAAVSAKSADTNYERNFQERYSVLITNTINELNQPFNATKPFDGWLRIKQLYSVFQQRSLRGYASTLKIADLSPVLENMRNTAISMPGVDTYAKEPVYIRSVDSAVHILPTKTKPKKLAFYGSDGRKYTYLFKGLEDLHLDERIMQFLSISNSMMARANISGTESPQRSRAFKAHHYSVIPLGPQSGLISWVDGVTPLFAVYKKWQQRDAALKQQQKERQSSQQNNTQQQSEVAAPTATRPSELFYSKLTPLLAEQGMKVTDPRKQWPLAILRRVLDELIKETPRDLLAKELWCMANTAADWRKSICSYAASLSVMSVIGYVIGLGDRHLDNVLINLTAGEIVHIDYNVCFEKGKTLRVPEKVPFRLTPNLEEALGITGIEGTFRLGCEHVLKILRKERETLLTLLEAFVYDPLVDWTVSDDGTTTVARATSAHAAALSLIALDATVTGIQKGGNNGKLNGPIEDATQRKQIWECTRQSLEVRMNELKPCWTQFRDDVQIRLTEIENALDRLITIQSEIRQDEQERDRLTKQTAMIRELEALGTAMGSHTLNTISERYNACKRDEEAFTVIKDNVQKYQSDTYALLQTYFEQLLSPNFTNELTTLQLRDQQQNILPNEFELIRSLLEQCGQERLYAQCDFTRKEMDNTLMQQSRCALECVELLQQYVGVIQFYPRSRLLQNHLLKYEQSYRELLNGERNVSELNQDFEDFINSEQSNGSKKLRKQAVLYAAALEKIWIERNLELVTAIKDLNDHNNQANNPFDAAATAIQTFITLNSDINKPALQLCMLETLSKANDAFLLYEEDALKTKDFYLLNQQINFLEMQQQMCGAAFPDLNQQYYVDVLTLYEALQSLYKLRNAFELSVPERIVCLFMKDDAGKTQAALKEICAYEPGDNESLLLNDQSVEVTLLINEIYALFDDFESRIKLLTPTVNSILETMSDSKVKQFLKSRLSGNTIEEIPSTLKYEVIADVFRLARDNVNSLLTNDLQYIYDVRQLSATLENYINTLLMKALCGLPTLYAHMLHNNLTNLVAKQPNNHNVMKPALLLNAEGLCKSLLQALQQGFSGKNYKMQVLLHTKLTEHCARVGSAHYWLNEAILQLGDKHLMYGFPKEKLLQSVQACSQSLSAWKHTMIKIHEDVDECTNAVIQQLNWSLNTNKSLLPLQDAFMECVKSQESRYNAFLQSTIQLSEYTNALLQFELLQSKDKRLQADNAFLAVLQQWHNAMTTKQQSSARITPVEQSIVQLLDPEGKVDQCWIQNIAGLLDEMTYAVQRKLAILEHEEEAIKEGLFEQGQQMLPLMDPQMRSDTRHLFKAITKNDRNTRNSASNEKVGFAAHARDLQHALRVFHTKLNELQMHLVARNLSDITPAELRAKVHELQAAHEQNAAGLMELAQRFKNEECESSTSSVTTDSPHRNKRSCAATLESKLKSAGGNAEENALATAEDGEKDKKATTTNNPGEQKRNAYAVSVWKRVRMKLEGRDPDLNRRCTIAEQVDYIIREAMNPDNLAVLYEGWTPWV